MNTRLKWMIEDSVNKGNKYDKIYHGVSSIEQKTSSVCEYVNNPKTFVNYGAVVKFCPKSNEVFFGIELPSRSEKKARAKHEKFIRDRHYRHCSCSFNHKTVRVISSEVKEIKANNNIIPETLLPKILYREV